MKVELKKIHYSASLSQETAAFVADVWVDGKLRGSVRNSGHGGPDIVAPPSLAAEIEAYAKTLPPLPGDAELGPLPMSAELLFAGLLEDHLASKRLKKLMKDRVLFTDKGRKGIFELRAIKGDSLSSLANAVRKSSKTDKVLNDLPFEEAVRIYRSA